jgi:hypothetical protein
MKRFVCVVVFVLLTGAAPVRGQDLPVPKRLVNARTAYLANGGVDLRAMEELHEHLRAWGRLTFVDDESKADVIITLERLATGEHSGSAVTFNPGSTTPTSVGGTSERQAWVLSVRAPGASAPLHGDREKIGGGQFGGIKHLVTRLRETVDRGGTRNPAGPIVPTATPEAFASSSPEPCRVFVTGDSVDPKWFVAVQEIEFTKRMNPSSNAAREEMAKRARKLGADAVLSLALETKRTAWSYPHSVMQAKGMAARWTDDGRRNFATLKGQCFN